MSFHKEQLRGSTASLLQACVKFTTVERFPPSLPSDAGSPVAQAGLRCIPIAQGSLGLLILLLSLLIYCLRDLYPDLKIYTY